MALLYDAAYACDIHASSDASMKNITPSDLGEVFANAPIKAIFANGAKSYEISAKHHAHYGVKIYKLPSTSPANAAASLDALIAAWQSALNEARNTK